VRSCAISCSSRRTLSLHLACSNVLFCHTTEIFFGHFLNEVTELQMSAAHRFLGCCLPLCASGWLAAMLSTLRCGCLTADLTLLVFRDVLVDLASSHSYTSSSDLGCTNQLHWISNEKCRILPSGRWPSVYSVWTLFPSKTKNYFADDFKIPLPIS